MRRFRFVGDPSHYTGIKKNNVYLEYFKHYDLTALELFSMYPEDWQEVFETEPKPLHKDTDLGAFSAMILSEIKNNPNYKLVPKIKLVSESISLARELIKQLDEEGHG